MAITGGMSAGKSTLASVLRRNGASVLSMDELAHGVYEPGKPVFKSLVRVFGRGILGANGFVNRGKLGRIVFRDPRALARLDGIVHPALRREARSAISRMRRSAPLLVVETGPLLFRLGLDRVADGAVLVTASRRERLARLISGRGLARADAVARLESSLAAEKYLEGEFNRMPRGIRVDASGPASRIESAAKRVMGKVALWK